MVARTLRLLAASTTRARHAGVPLVPAMLTLPGAFAALPPGCDQSDRLDGEPIAGVPAAGSSPALVMTARRSPGKIVSLRSNGLRPLSALQPPRERARRPNTRTAGRIGRLIMMLRGVWSLRRNCRAGPASGRRGARLRGRRLEGR